MSESRRRSTRWPALRLVPSRIRLSSNLRAQHIPNWERVHGEVRAQARKTLQNAGLSENDIKRLWSGDEAVDAHSSVLQLILAKAALWDLAQEKARQVRQTNLPQVIRPGTYRAPRMVTRNR